MIQGLVIKLIFNAIYKAIQKKHNFTSADKNELRKKRLKKYESALKKAGIIKEKKRLKRR